MNPALRDALLDACAVLLPVACAGCGAEDRALCDSCRRRLAPEPQRGTLAHGLPVLSALQYSGPVRQMLLAFKEQGRTDLARPLARPLAVLLDALLADPAVPAGVRLGAVPGRRAAFRRRGYDPVSLLLRRAGFRPDRVLVHTRAHPDQKLLDRTARAANLVESMAARRRLSGGEFILVDDILTTGATLTEAVRAIRGAGGEVRCAVTLAYTPKVFWAA